MRVDPFFLGQGDDAVDVQIGFHRPLALADLVGFVGFEAVQAQPVFFGIDGDGAQAELGRRAHDADGDFTAIEGEQFFHSERIQLFLFGRRPWPRFSDAPGSWDRP